MDFKIDGSASGHHPYGDGMAMWLTEERGQPGPIFGSKDYFTGIGLMFDTFANARHVGISSALCPEPGH
jgi:mannose-binding lectin 2